MKSSPKTKKIAVGAMLIAFCILLPQIFHFTGIPQAGAVFLPMHIPVLLAGFFIGPLYGAIIGIISPVLSCAITNMPDMARLPFMAGELFAYGLVSGLMYHKLNFKSRKFGEIITLLCSMLAGRLFYAVMLIAASELLNIECGGVMAAVSATVTGIYGIILQITVIPIIVYAVKKGGFIIE